MATGLPFVDLATNAGNWVRDWWNGEKENDYEGIDPSEDPNRVAEIQKDAATEAMVLTQTQSMVNQSLINQALAVAKAKEKQLLMIGGGLLVAWYLFSDGKKSKRKRRR